MGLKFKDGVLLAADTLGSYGSLARFRECRRVLKVNDNIVLGAGGDYADYQYLQSIIKQKVYVLAVSQAKQRLIFVCISGWTSTSVMMVSP